jgi:hypothetical protein
MTDRSFGGEAENEAWGFDGLVVNELDRSL